LHPLPAQRAVRVPDVAQPQAGLDQDQPGVVGFQQQGVADRAGRFGALVGRVDGEHGAGAEVVDPHAPTLRLEAWFKSTSEAEGGMAEAGLDGLLDIGEVARRSGLAPSALRFYGKKGLISAAPRNGLRRAYEPEVMHRIGLITCARSAGFSIAE